MFFIVVSQCHGDSSKKWKFRVMQLFFTSICHSNKYSRRNAGDFEILWHQNNVVRATGKIANTYIEGLKMNKYCRMLRYDRLQKPNSVVPYGINKAF